MRLLSAEGIVREDVEEPPGSAPASLIPPDLHRILYYASLAPSGHNAQPWTVRLDGQQMWIGTDSARWLPNVDPTNREVTLSVGAFIENLIAAAPAGTEASFYRTAAGAEIDLLLMLPGGRLWAIEVKRSLAPKVEKGFHQACEDLKPERRFVVYPGSEAFPLKNGAEAMGPSTLAKALATA